MQKPLTRLKYGNLIHYVTKSTPFSHKTSRRQAVDMIAAAYETNATVRMTSCFNDDAYRFQRT